MKDYCKILADFFIFEGLSEDELSLAVSTADCYQMEYASGKDIFSPSSHKRSVGYIVKGSVSVFKSNGDKKTLLNIIGRGNAFGVAGLFSDEYPTCVTAKTKCTVVFIDADKMLSLIEKFPTVAKNYIRFLSDRIRFLNDKIDSFTKGSVEGRVAKLLLSRANGSVTSIGNMSRTASALDIGRASLYRILSLLEEKGIIEQNENEIIIKDKTYLERTS